MAQERRKSLGKKGSLQDILFTGIVLLVFSITILIGFTVYNAINVEFQDSPDITTRGKTASQKINNLYPGVIDNSFLLLTVGLTIVAFILAALVRIHPVFIALFIIALTFIVFLSGIFSNIYQEIASNADMIDIANQLRFTSTIMNFLPLFVGVLGGILAVVMYKTGSRDEFI